MYLPKIYNGRNKSFFFFSLEASAGSQASETSNVTVPPAAWRNGDFSRLATVVKDPTTDQEFPGKRIPASRINDTSQQIQERFYPLPNSGNPNVLAASNYRVQRFRERDPNRFATVRGDHRFSATDTLYGRFTWQRAYNNVFETLPTIGQRTQRREHACIKPVAYARFHANARK